MLLFHLHSSYSIAPWSLRKDFCIKKYRCQTCWWDFPPKQHGEWIMLEGPWNNTHTRERGAQRDSEHTHCNFFWTHTPVPSPLPPYLSGHILSPLPQVPDRSPSSDPKGCQIERRISLAPSERWVWDLGRGSRWKCKSMRKGDTQRFSSELFTTADRTSGTQS